jgi:hypothetical protein
MLTSQRLTIRFVSPFRKGGLTRLRQGLRTTGVLLLMSVAGACSPIDAGVPLDLGVAMGEITAYPVMCEVELEGGDCPLGRGLPLNWTTYKVYVDQQMVVANTRGGFVRKFNNCAVADRVNWQCARPDDSGTFGFSEGRYWESSKKASLWDEQWKRVIYVSVVDYTAHSDAFVTAKRKAALR